MGDEWDSREAAGLADPEPSRAELCQDSLRSKLLKCLQISPRSLPLPLAQQQLPKPLATHAGEHRLWQQGLRIYLWNNNPVDNQESRRQILRVSPEECGSNFRTGILDDANSRLSAYVPVQADSGGD
jgi:hypothetical protein